ncbi:hypothetical protein [Streptomyces niveus]
MTRCDRAAPIAAGAILVGVLALVAFRIWAGSVADNFAATRCTLSGEYEDELRCLAERGTDSRYLGHQPASHFWPLQPVKTGIVLVAATACVLTTFKVLGRCHNWTLARAATRRGGARSPQSSGRRDRSRYQ